jgi:lipid-A-disaccharide synthase
VRVVYYISPQVWAWRRGRVRQIARRVEKMLVLFPFEVDFYHRSGVDVAHVGHPLVDEVPQLPQAWARGGAERPYRLALLPGSRRSEVEALLPTMLESVRRLAADLPVAARLIRAPTIPEEMLATEVARVGVPVEIVAADRFTAIADSHLALCASGTATLEVGLLGTPMIVLYRLKRWSYLLARLLVRLDHFSLVNLVLGREVVPELLQDEANPERVAAEARRLLTDEAARERMRSGLATLRGQLGEGGASRRAAREVVTLLGLPIEGRAA